MKKKDSMVTIIINSPDGKQIHTYYMDFMAARLIDIACTDPETYLYGNPLKPQDFVNVTELERKLYPKVKK